MANKRKILTISSLAIIMVTGIIISARRTKANKIYKKLIDSLQTGENVEGTINDLTLTAFNPAYYKTFGYISLPSDENASSMAKAIEGSLHSWPKQDDIDRIISEMTLARTKAGVSKIASFYKSIFDDDMIDDLKSYLDSSELEQINSLLKNMPNT